MGIWYRAGTVAVTAGSKTVTGTGTQWQNLIFGVATGVTFYGPDGKPYEIDTVNSNTSLTLATNYSGATASGQAYAIDPTRSGSVASLAAQTSEVLKFSQGQFTQIQNWFTGAASANVTLTSPAGQTITVPSYSKVTSEGEGQAARAKTEADKAAVSAAAAAAAVLAAQLPTPDVSIPFTTDGLMTRGKGAPVLVGTTPVAQRVTYERLGTQTMIDKSGRLVTVPAGEMAIEQQGLAIFDQSVNLAAPSINWAASANMAAAWTHGTVDASGWIAVSGSGDPSKTEGSYKDFSVPTAGSPHTLSLDVLKATGLNVKLRTYGHESNGVDITITETAVSGSGGSDVYDMGHYWRVELTRTFTGATRLFRIYPFGLNAGSAGTMSYRRVQLEAKSFATPYIENASSAQSTRPATTRCDIPWPGNMQPLTNWQELTISFEFDIAGSLAAGGAQHIFANGSGGNYLLARIENNGVLRFYRSASSTHQHTLALRRRYKMCYRINRNLCDLFIDGVRIGGSITASPVTTGLPDLLRLGYSSSPGQCLNGHLRNINIWNTPLTDAQCVAASS